MDYFEYRDTVMERLRESVKVSSRDLSALTLWKRRENYCFGGHEQSLKLLRFFRSMFVAERLNSQIRVQELARGIFSIWCKGTENAKLYFQELDKILSKNKDILTYAARGDFPHFNATVSQQQIRLQALLGFLKNLYSLKELASPGADKQQQKEKDTGDAPMRKPYLATIFAKSYHQQIMFQSILQQTMRLFEPAANIPAEASEDKASRDYREEHTDEAAEAAKASGSASPSGSGVADMDTFEGHEHKKLMEKLQRAQERQEKRHHHHGSSGAADDGGFNTKKKLKEELKQEKKKPPSPPKDPTMQKITSLLKEVQKLEDDTNED
jgi:hypothetical protein